jgi:hypothetical protein
MKRLIVISVVFALIAAGTAFAVDLGGEVIGTVEVLKGDSTEDSKITSGASLNRIRLQGEGANDDGTFGGWIRAEAGGAASFSLNDKVLDGSYDPDTDGDPFSFSGGGGGFAGHAWWKPIDQLKLWIGSNGGDGFFAKEGNTGWMFYQRATDPGITIGGANVWGGPSNGTSLVFRNAFYGGGIDGGNAFYMTISPVDIVDINIEIPFFQGGEVKDVFGNLVAQVSFNLDFGNIALTYAGDASDATNGNAYVYFNLAAIDNLSLDVGIGLTLPGDQEGQPIAAGLGVKYDVNDAFGLKFRTAASFGGDDKAFRLLADVLPYYTLTDNVKAFLSGGVTMLSPEEGDAVVGFHLNPYIWVGQEWGPCFWAGFKMWSDGKKGADDKAVTNWSVPIAIGVSF